MPKSNSSQYPNQFQAQMSTPKMNTDGKSLKRILKSNKRDFFKISLTIKCYKCQGYGHVAANCPSPVKDTIDKKLFVINSEFDSWEVISEEEPADYDSDKDIKSDDMKSNIQIAPEDTTMIIEFTDAFLKDNTPIPPEVTLWLWSLLMSFRKIPQTNSHLSVTSNTLLSLI